MPGRSKTWGTTPALLVAAVLVAGCGGSSGPDAAPRAPSPAGTAATTSSPAPTPTVSTGATTTASADPKAVARLAVAADFGRYDRAFLKMIKARTTRVPDLRHFTTAKKFAADRTRVETMHSRGIVYKGGAQSWVGAVSVTGNRASLHLCEKDDAGWYLYVASGKLVNPVLDRWVAYLVRAIHRDGRWQFDSVTAVKRISCKAAN